jgi:dipeptidyl aminopeptidase/acylaminoacyl peptidase
VDTGYVDARRIGITGGSYGGYLTLAALTKKPDVFAAGVEMFGIVNWRTMWEHSPPQNRRYLSTLLGGSPEEFPEVYDRTSPLTYLSQTRAPLLVLQGENDPLVPAIEARQVVEGLSAMNKVVDSIFYKDEGHGFVALENRIDATTRTLDWFDRHLGATPARERLEGGQ